MSNPIITDGADVIDCPVCWRTPGLEMETCHQCQGSKKDASGSPCSECNAQGFYFVPCTFCSPAPEEQSYTCSRVSVVETQNQE